MTVSTTTNKVSGLGNASATVFSFSPIVIFASTDLVVTHVSSAGVETTLTEGTGATNYSVSVASYPGTGSITYPADAVTPMAAGEKVVMKRVLTLEQETDLQNQGGFNAEVLETQLDKLVMLDLQQQEVLDRSVTLPIGVSGVSAELPVPAASRLIGWNAAADALSNFASSGEVAFSAFAETLVDDTTAGDMLTTLGVSAYAQTILDDANAATARTTLGAAALAANTFTGIQDFGAAARFTKGADIASATTLVLGTDGNFFDITGTTTITGITAAAGSFFMFQFDGILTLTHGASLLLPTAANITTAVGDRLIGFATAADTIIVLVYTRADGTSLVAGDATLDRKVGSATASAAATLAVTSGIGTADVYVINLTGIVSSSDNVDLRMEVSTDGGSTWKTGVSDYGWGLAQQYDNGADTFTNTNVSDSNAASIGLTAPAVQGFGTGTNEKGHGRVTIYKPSAGNVVMFEWSLVFRNADSGAIVAVRGVGHYKGGTSAVDAVRFAFDTGNITGKATVRAEGE
jgi:hypothetical protein